ncbi:MAG TPA: hypothetical protein PKV98_10105 [Burkholderiaceae bacterium]|nr:hypothetical protein [Burkholderiaceae bacterium]
MIGAFDNVNSEARRQRVAGLDPCVYTFNIHIGVIMSATPSKLLLKFRTRDTQFGVTRKTVKAMAARFDLSETEIVHMALSRMAKEELPAYEADEGPLSARDVKALAKIAGATLPKGRVIKKQSLF